MNSREGTVLRGWIIGIGHDDASETHLEIEFSTRPPRREEVWEKATLIRDKHVPDAEPLNQLASEIVEINRANGWAVATADTWDDERHIPTLLCLIHSEVSEALEGFRAGDRENVAEELADVLIRVLDLAGGLGIDMDREVRAKLEKNRQRGHKHGGKRI